MTRRRQIPPAAIARAVAGVIGPYPVRIGTDSGSIDRVGGSG
ncbi:hypothetical protein OCAE111667_23155 [Occultella aeris]|uniref:Uncharacterized protein n=1 Tax=Occultella aeris TaxID=2761496 RepID=A0A7M4DJ50_9MICO|nr:hypothetical protein HALOF300_02153 [Occultella aeris]